METRRVLLQRPDQFLMYRLWELQHPDRDIQVEIHFFFFKIKKILIVEFFWFNIAFEKIVQILMQMFISFQQVSAKQLRASSRHLV